VPAVAVFDGDSGELGHACRGGVGRAAEREVLAGGERGRKGDSDG